MRNSDDFFPEIPSSHAWHLWANAHNAIFTQHLNAVLDWNMFQTDHEYSAHHAAARCLSGGPIMITDTPGKHDVGLMNQMVALGLDGRSVALRPKTAKTARAFDRWKETGLLKIVTETESGVKMLGCFNTGDTVLEALIPTAEIANIGLEKPESGKDVLLWSHQQQKAYGPTALDHAWSAQAAPNKLLSIELPVRGFDIYTAYDVQTLNNGPTSVQYCLLGLLGKMTGAAAIQYYHAVTSLDEGKVVITATVKALGTLRIWASVSDGKKIDVSVQLVDGENGPIPTQTERHNEGHWLSRVDLLPMRSTVLDRQPATDAVSVEVVISLP